MTDPILTARLSLRTFVAADAPRLAELGGDRAIADTTISVPHPFTPSLAAAWIEQRRVASNRHVTCAICRRTSPELVGYIGIVEIDHEHALGELSFWVGRPFWGAGIASEAAAAIVELAFQGLDLNRLQAYHMVRNPASGRVLARLGFQREGLLRQRVRKWGVFEDVVICGLVRADWSVGVREE